MHRATLKEVARKAGVHPATASRALNTATRSQVNEQTAQGVLAAATELGYVANPIARSLKTARSSSIGLVLPDLTNPIFPPIVRGIEDVMREVGYSAWIVNTDNDPVKEASAVESFRQRSVEGFVFATARLEHPLIQEMAAAATPLVLVNRRVSGVEVPSVTADDETGISLAMEHLYELGHRQIVHVAGPQELSTGLFRKRAFRGCLEEMGLPAGPERVVVCDTWSEASGDRALSKLIDDGVPFTAVVAGNDLLALGCFDVLARAGLRCPADVSVVGFNDTPFMDKVSPALTTVRIPQYDLGAEAARLLLEMLQDPARHPRSLLLPPSLVVRESTGPVGVGIPVR
ncbi:MAG: LacI family transcriptional regulator [Actinomycetota bacterium]|nr:LacI family transcriptional regulator [Actinomycetota bacterium]